MTTLYGIKNCDTVSKARRWLEDHNIDYSFHDFRQDGIDEKLIESWYRQCNWETLVNKRSTTWKGLDEQLRKHFDKDAATRTMLEHPTLIKRPVLDHGRKILVGFKAEDYASLFR